MDRAKTLTFYLNAPMRKRAEAGKTNIINRISTAFEARGFQSVFCEDTDAELLGSAGNSGFSMFHMEDPFHARALSLRRAYYYPFWSIETTMKRWDWAVARAKFDPDEIDALEAQRFAAYWRKRLFGMTRCKEVSEGFVFAPLQGKLLDKRSFQTLSPLDMLAATLDADKSRLVYISLHPRENYTDQEMRALSSLVDRNPRLRMGIASTADLLAGCEYVVAQNSAVVLDAYFHRKPAVLFAKSDFHHIAANVADLGIAGAFERVFAKTPDFDAYLYWFLQAQSLNAGRDGVEEKILATVRKFGWMV